LSLLNEPETACPRAFMMLMEFTAMRAISNAFRLRKKGGKPHDIPTHHKVEAYNRSKNLQPAKVELDLKVRRFE
jgi:hypothetical protein